MKQVLWGMLLATVLALGVTPSNIAHAAAPETIITGYVFKNGAPLPGMVIFASCGPFGADVDATDATGAYLTSLPISQCGWGSHVELFAFSSHDTGSAQGTVHKVTSKLNIVNTNILIE